MTTVLRHSYSTMVIRIVGSYIVLVLYSNSSISEYYHTLVPPARACLYRFLLFQVYSHSYGSFHDARVPQRALKRDFPK